MDDPIKISPQLLSKAGASTVRLPPGDVIFKDGDAPDKMYVAFPVWSRFTYEMRSLRPCRRAEPLANGTHRWLAAERDSYC